MQAIQNLGLALITMLSGVVVDKLGYLWLETFFIFWLIVALICTVVIWLIDINGNGYLNMGVDQRDAYDRAEREREEEARRQQELLRERMRPRTGMDLRIRYI